MQQLNKQTVDHVNAVSQTIMKRK